MNRGDWQRELDSRCTRVYSDPKEIEATITLKKMLKLDSQNKANEETQAHMETEDALDSRLINELISKTTTEQTNSLRAELGQVKKQLQDLQPSKNSGRGPSGGASARNKKITKKRTTNKKTQRNTSSSQNNQRNNERSSGQKVGGRGGGSKRNSSRKEKKNNRKRN